MALNGGALVDEVKSQINDQCDESENNPIFIETVYDFMEIDNLQALLMYEFEENKLTKIYTPTVINLDNSLTKEEMKKLLYDKFVEKYGDCDEENTNEYVWNKKKTKITIEGTRVEFTSK